MSVLLANGIDVAESYIHLPRYGRGWIFALLDRKSGVGSGDAVTLQFESGEEMSSTCQAVWLENGFLKVRLVLGRDKIANLVPQKFYEGVPAATVAADLVRDCGEQAGEIVAPEMLTQWVRHKSAGGAALTQLCQAVGISWRIGINGLVSCKSESKPTNILEFETLATSYRTVMLPLTPSLEPFSHLLRLSNLDSVIEVVPTAVRHLLHSSVIGTEVQW